MQMREPRLAIDVMGMSGGSGDAGVDRLTALPDHDQLVDEPATKWAEKLLPGRRQRVTAGPKGFRYRCPRRRLRAIFRITGIIWAELAKAPIGHHVIPAFGARRVVP